MRKGLNSVLTEIAAESPPVVPPEESLGNLTSKIEAGKRGRAEVAAFLEEENRKGLHLFAWTTKKNEYRREAWGSTDIEARMSRISLVAPYRGTPMKDETEAFISRPP